MHHSPQQGVETMYNIKRTRHFYAPTPDRTDLVDDGQHTLLEFPTLEAAEAYIKERGGACYWLDHNESGRPSYEPVLTPKAKAEEEARKAREKAEREARFLAAHKQQVEEERIYRAAPYKMVPAPRANPEKSLYGPWIIVRKGDKKTVCRGDTRDHCEEVFWKYCKRRDMNYDVALGHKEGNLHVNPWSRR